MSDNSTLKKVVLFVTAVLVPCLGTLVSEPSWIVPSSLVAAAIYAVLTAVAPVPLALAVPIIVYGINAVLGGDYVFAAFPLIFLPAGFGLGLCMRKKCSRRVTVATTSVSLVAGGALGFVLATLTVFGKLTAATLADCYSGLYSYVANSFYENMYTSLKSAAYAYELKDFDAAAYTKIYLKSCRPMLIGSAIFACNALAYILTAVSKYLLKHTSIEQFKSLPGINGNWEFVLSKTSAVVFIVCYACITLGGDALALPELSAFYAILFAIIGGVLIMALRTVRNKMHLGGSIGFIVTGIIIFFFFQGSILSIIVTVLAIIGLTATLKKEKTEDKKQ